MRWTASAPVTWPSDQGWDTWWRGAVARELDSFLDTVAAAGASSGESGLGDHMELVTGEHLRPGAVYRWVPPEGEVSVSAAWGIGGHPDRRDLYGEFQEIADPKHRVVVRVDGLDACASGSATSTLEHLGLKASFVPARDALLDIEVTLDWLLVRLAARVVPAAAGEQLHLSLRVVGRGLWKPVIAPLLVPLGVALNHVLAQQAEEAADRLTHLETDPTGQGGPERALEQIRGGAELIRGRLHEVVRLVDARPWRKGRRAAQLSEAFDGLPAVGAGWPPVAPVMTFAHSGRWWDEEQWIFDQILQAPPWRRHRHAAVDGHVDSWLRHQEQITAITVEAQAAHRAADTSGGPVTARSAAEITEMLDLSWLASPWSTVRQLAKQAATEGAGEGLPPLETDEDARAFLVDMLPAPSWWTCSRSSEACGQAPTHPADCSSTTGRHLVDGAFEEAVHAVGDSAFSVDLPWRNLVASGLDT